MSISCSLVVTCWERTDLLAPLYVMLSCFLSPSHTIPCHGSCAVLDCIDSLHLPSSFFVHEQYAVLPVRLKPATLLSRLKHYTTGYCTRILCGEQMKVSDYCYDLGVKGLGQYILQMLTRIP